MNGNTKTKATKSTLTPSDTVGDRFNAPYKGFINFNPSQAQKEDFSEWADSTDFWETLYTHLRLGRKFNCALDKDGKTFCASLMERDKLSPNAGLIATARGLRPDVAAWRLFYYVGELFPQDWNALFSIDQEDRWT